MKTSYHGQCVDLRMFTVYNAGKNIEKKTLELFQVNLHCLAEPVAPCR